MNNKWVALPLLLPLFALLAACEPATAPAAPETPAAPVNTAIGVPAISAEDIASHVAVLASDEFGGRGPSSPGEELTVNYIRDQFAALGLKPGNGDSYFQEVPLAATTAAADASLVISGGQGADQSLAYADEMVIWTDRITEHAAIKDSDLVFVGYGIVAPEYNWNDYEGIDVKGKTVVMLVNDPGYATQDPKLFTGNAMTYYGRYTYKYEEAAKQGAAGALIIHQSAPASYGWATVRNSWTGPRFQLEAPDNNMWRAAVEGWLTEASSRALFARAGMDMDKMIASASKQGFKASAMGLKASAEINNSVRHSLSKNVIALLPGSETPDEYFVYMAHWDHLGTDAALQAAGKDGIYNGALDNASGTAALLELAQAFATAPTPPKRSVIFLSVTAEEQGLLGSAHYGKNPLFPLAQTVAGLNMDGINTLGATKEISVSGYGLSELDAVLEQAAASQGRRVDPESTPEKGYYYRSDHFNLAKQGVPMIYPRRGVDHITEGKAYGLAKAQEYIDTRYHMPTDEFDATWDLSGAAADVQLYYAVGEAVLNSGNWPNWQPGTEFRAIRDASRPPAE